MKKIIAILSIMILGITAQAERIELDTNSIQLPVATITGFDVGGIQFNTENSSWNISVRPNLEYQVPESTNGVTVGLLLDLRISITVERAEIEAAVGEDVDNITVLVLNQTVRAIAFSKAIAVLTKE